MQYARFAHFYQRSKAKSRCFNTPVDKKLSYRRETLRQLRMSIWLTDRATHRTPQNCRCCTTSLFSSIYNVCAERDDLSIEPLRIFVVSSIIIMSLSWRGIWPSLNDKKTICARENALYLMKLQSRETSTLSFIHDYPMCCSVQLLMPFFTMWH